MRKSVTAGLLPVLFVASLLAPLVSAEPPALAQVGQKHFIRCTSCHAMSADAPALAGPHLAAIVGRKVAAAEGYQYSTALRAQTFVWTEEQLDKWLERPQQLVPDMCMPFMGLSNPDVRKALIAYLKKPPP